MYHLSANLFSKYFVAQILSLVCVLFVEESLLQCISSHGLEHSWCVDNFSPCNTMFLGQGQCFPPFRINDAKPARILQFLPNVVFLDIAS